MHCNSSTFNGNTVASGEPQDTEENKDYDNFFEQLEIEILKYKMTEMKWNDVYNLVVELRGIRPKNLYNSQIIEIKESILAKFPEIHTALAEYFLIEEVKF